jgi:hypothetical protein
MSRKAISKKLRFEVFKRDNFTCQYCGKAAPDVVLHIDHINPVAGGGDSDILNLITSCIDCNLGKGARELSDDSAIQKQRAQLAELNERREQLEMMLAWREGLATLDEQKVEAFNAEFESHTNCTLNEHGKAKVKRWLKHNSLKALLDALDAAIETYYKGGHEDPEENNRLAGEAFNRVLSVIRGKVKYANKPHMRDLFYIRGILRNRHYCNDRKAIELLEEAFDAGIPIEDLKSDALASRSWTAWHRNLADAIDAIYEYEGEPDEQD